MLVRSACSLRGMPRLVMSASGQTSRIAILHHHCIMQSLVSMQGETAEVFLHGAHVTSWKSASGQERLFVSKQALFQPPKAIRGGVPVCFPQFGALGPLGQHGFARNTEFEVEGGNSWGVTLASSLLPRYCDMLL